MNKKHRNLFFTSVLGLSVLSCGTAWLNAQDVKPVVVPAAVKVPDSPAKKDDKPKPIKEVLPDAQKIDGLITMYRKKEKLYAEIKGSNLNTDYLIAMAVAKGSGWSAIGGYTLQDGDDWLWQFRKVNDNIQVVRRNIKFKADSGTPEAQAVDVAYSDSVLYSLPILATGDGGGDVIDMASIFMADLPKLGIGSFDRSRSLWGPVKGFDNNVEFRVVATYSGYRYSSYSGGDDSSPDPSSVGVTIHYSISKLPSSGYTSRLADPRIGYFTVSHKNYSKAQEDDHTIRYINRWNLQKADSSATLSPPKKPIVFWIEKTVPFKYRNAVREGILEWNKAFEKVGIVNAIEVRQQSDSDTWDAEDINYNTIRWITSDAGFAMGPSRVNPLTGEILDADIIIDAGWIDFWKERFDYFISDLLPKPDKNGAAEPFARQRALREMKKTAKEHADNHDGLNHCTCTYAQDKAAQLALASLALADDDEADEEKKDEKKEEEKADEKKDEKKEDGEKSAEEKKDEKPSEEKKDEKKEDAKKDGEKKDEKKDGEKKDDDKKDEKKDGKDKKPSKAEKEKERAAKFEKLVQEGLKDLVMHEVGHTLGLRHNFQASSWLTLEEINKPNRSKEFGIAGSVMDYLAINIAPKGKPQGDYFMCSLGPYDYLAIEYGYKILSGGTEGETSELSKIAAKQSEKGNNFATDEDLWLGGSDPRTGLRDLGSNPMAFAKSNLERYKQLLPQILDRSIRENGSYRDVGRYFTLLLSDRLRGSFTLVRNVGGLYSNRDRRGDPNGRPPIQVVDAKTQREAVKFLCENTFGADTFKLSPEIYNQFGTERWISGNRMTGNSNIPLGELIAEIQCYTLEEIVGPWTLESLADTAFRVPESADVYTAEELFTTLTASIFSELNTIKDDEFTNRKPAIPQTRRTLQNYYFSILSLYTVGRASYYYDVVDLTSEQSLARQQLTKISSLIQSLLSGKAKLDTASRAHLASLQERIKKVLDADVVRNRP